MRNITTPRLLVVAAAALLALSGCATAGAATSPAQGTTADAAHSLSVTDAWVKSSAQGMSGAFATLTNAGSADLTVVSASTPAATMVELHETAANAAGDMVMRKKDGGFVVPAGGSLTLAPGANHLMLMGLTAPLSAGDEVAFTLTFSDGSTRDFTAPAKDFSGANETYEGGMTTEPSK
jgi:copper(I)-binding protein